MTAQVAIIHTTDVAADSGWKIISTPNRIDKAPVRYRIHPVDLLSDLAPQTDHENTKHQRHETHHIEKRDHGHRWIEERIGTDQRAHNTEQQQKHPAVILAVLDCADNVHHPIDQHQATPHDLKQHGFIWQLIDVIRGRRKMSAHQRGHQFDTT